MVKPVSDLDKMALNNIHVHHLICPLAQGGLCKPYGRLYVNLDESDEFGTFIFRTTGFNSIRTLAARFVITMQHRVIYFHVCHCN
jgi:hypothetical protein